MTQPYKVQFYKAMEPSHLLYTPISNSGPVSLVTLYCQDLMKENKDYNFFCEFIQ
jgi:hypothetical protein